MRLRSGKMAVPVQKFQIRTDYMKTALLRAFLLEPNDMIDCSAA